MMRLLPDDPELGWTPYAWLIYLSFLIADPYFNPYSATETGLTVAAVVVFLVLYFRGHWLKGRAILPIIAVTAALGYGMAFINPGACVFVIYAGAFAANLEARRKAYGVVVVLALGIAFEAWWLHLSPNFWLPGVVFTLLIGAVNIHFTEYSLTRKALRMSQEEVTRLAQVAERERIARDLHDLLGHTLSMITLKAELASKLVTRHPEKAVTEIRDVERISRQALKEVRAALVGYRSHSLTAEIENARAAFAAAGVDFEVEGAGLELAPAQEGVLALALREAVTNVVRHAGARSCRVSITRQNEHVRLVIEDDGRGAVAPEGGGLTGMRERVASLGGWMERQVEKGTRLVVSLPLGLEAPGAAEARV